MKSKMKHFKISAFLIVCVMLVATLSSLTVGATDDCIHTLSNGIITVKHTIADKAFPTRDSVPEDCLFAGWYADSECVTPVASAEEISEGTVYAKYVPKKVLSIKAQVIDTLTNDSVNDDDFAKVRFVSSVDDLHYEQIGFKISYTKVDAKNETTLPLESTSFKKVYTRLYCVGSNKEVMTVTPSEEFHETASQYFVACTIGNIDFKNYETIFTVTPYWVTLNGEKIEGVTRSVTVADGCVREKAWVDANGTDACNYGSSAHPYKTLEYAVSKANSVTWKENQSPTVTVTSDLDIANTIQFTKPLTITSNKDVTLNRKTGNKNMFKISSDSSDSNVDVKIIGATDTMITINGGTAQGNPTGARIGFFENGKITLENAIVTNSYVNEAGAGAIYFSNELVCNNVIFQNNGAITNGGAVQNAGKGQYTNVTFESNSTSASDEDINGGGAVHIGSAGTATFTGCKFTSNQSANQGGAIYTTKAITLNDCTFTSNQSTKEGGAIFITSSGVVEVNDNCVFNGNKSTANNGGAICNVGTLTVTETNKFVSNTATGKGGAIANYKELTMNGDCEFTSNKSKYGGAIYASSGKVTINGKIVFKENEITTGGTHGGAIFNDGSSEMKLLGESTFDSNKSVTHGGAICNTNTLEIAGSSEFVSNESANQGGAIYTTKAITLNDCTFTSNQSTNEGGAIFARLGSHKFSGTNCTFDGNTSSKSSGWVGAGLYLTGSGTATLINDTKTAETDYDYEKAYFKSHTTTGGGASIIVADGATLNITGYKFENNSAVGGGAGIYLKDATSNDKDCIYTENTGKNGVAVRVYTGSTFTKNGGRFEGNTSNGDKGSPAIYNQDNCTVKNVTFTNNKTLDNYDGGAVYNTGTLNVNGGCNFIRNQATKNAGAICNTGTLKVAGTNEFTSNTAGQFGGAIGNYGTLELDGVNTFTSNTATVDGGVIFSRGTLTIKGQNNFNGNIAKNHGGVIFNDSGTLTINGQNNFIGNIAENHGGAICNTATINLQGNGTFKSNQATNDGGAIHNAGTLNMSECLYTFSGNKAEEKGGAIRTDTAITVKNCTFTSNTAPSGSNITIKTGFKVTQENNTGLDENTIATH